MRVELIREVKTGTIDFESQQAGGRRLSAGARLRRIRQRIAARRRLNSSLRFDRARKDTPEGGRHLIGEVARLTSGLL